VPQAPSMINSRTRNKGKINYFSDKFNQNENDSLSNNEDNER
jgi:hypothetical protein